MQLYGSVDAGDCFGKGLFFVILSSFASCLSSKFAIFSTQKEVLYETFARSLDV